MSLPVADQLQTKVDQNTSTIQDSDSLTTTVNDEIILASIYVSKTASQSAVSSVVKFSGTNTMGSFTKLAEFASADHFVSVWWAHQTVKGSFVVRWTTTVGCTLSTDYNLKVTHTYTGAKADQTGAAAQNTNYASATASPTAPLTTTAADSMVFGDWVDTGGSTSPSAGTNTNIFDDSSWAHSLVLTRFTGSTASPGLTTQAVGTYNGTTEFIGQVLAYELLAAPPVIVAPQPLPPEVILSQYGIDPWAQPVPLTDTTTPPVNAAAEVAAGVGAASDAVPDLDLPTGNAAGTGAATAATVVQVVNVSAGLASGTGVASNATVTTSVVAAAGNAAGTGAATAASVIQVVNASAGLAAGTGTASNATLTESLPAGNAAGVGAASNATVTTNVVTNAAAGNAAGTGAASNATVTTNVATNAAADLAAGTGAATAATTKESVAAGNAAGVGAASNATVTTNVATNAAASNAAGTGAAANATVTTGVAAAASNAAGAGAAAVATTKETVAAGLATGTGTAAAGAAKASPTAGIAAGTGAAANATVSTLTTTNAPAGVAAGTGVAQTAKATISRAAALVSGVGTAYNGTGGIGASGRAVGYLLLQNAPSSIIGSVTADAALISVVGSAYTASVSTTPSAPAPSLLSLPKREFSPIASPVYGHRFDASSWSAINTLGYSRYRFNTRPFSVASPFNILTPGGTVWYDTTVLHQLPDTSALHWYMGFNNAIVWFGHPGDPWWTVDLPDYIYTPSNRNRAARKWQIRGPENMLDGQDIDHVFIHIDATNGDLTEVWNASVDQRSRYITNGSVDQGSAPGWSTGNVLTSPGAGTLGNNDGTRAANFSWLAGLITGHDMVLGAFDHALGVALPYHMLKGGGSNFIAPATSGDFGGWGGPIWMGSKIGVPAGTTQPGGLSNIGVMLWNCLINYGMYVGDFTGGQWPQFYVDKNSVTTAQCLELFAYWDYAGSADFEKIMPSMRVANYQP